MQTLSPINLPCFGGFRSPADDPPKPRCRWVWSLATTGLPVKLLGEICPSGSSLPAKPYTSSHLSLPEKLGNRNFSRQLLIRYHSAFVLSTCRRTPVWEVVSMGWQEPCYSSIPVGSERNVMLLAPAYRRQGQGGGFRAM